MGDRVTQIFVEPVQAKEPAHERATHLFVEMVQQKNAAHDRTTHLFIEIVRSRADLPAFMPRTRSF